MSHIFEKASRLKLTIPTNRGSLNVDDLWDLTLAQLNSIAIENNSRIVKSEVSFLDDSENSEPSSDKYNSQLVLDLCKHVISVKQSESKAKKDETSKRKEIEILTDLLNRKESDKLQEMSAEEIQDRLKSLQS
jgi:hypothetical protein